MKKDQEWVRKPRAQAALPKSGFLAIGVDVSENRGLDIVCLHGNRHLVGLPYSRQAPEDLPRILKTIRPTVVAIDSPPFFGIKGSSRRCEQILRRYGILSFATPSDPIKQQHPFYNWMRIGQKTFREAEASGYRLYSGGLSVAGRAIEVFPHASAAALKGSLPPLGWSRRSRLKWQWRQAVLADQGIDTTALGSLDLIDAALAALTGILALEEQFTPIGHAEDGIIVLPSLRLPKRFAREADDRV